MASLDHRLNPLFSIKECMTCGALYTRNCGCSKGGLEDKILVPIPDLSQRPPQNCATCGNPVDGLYCRSCAFVRKCLNEGWYTIHDENEILNTFESSNDNTNVLSAPSRANHENSLIYNSKNNSFNDSPSVLTHPPQLQFETYFCEICGNNAHYGYDCPPQFPLVYEQEPCHNQNFNDNYFPQNSQSSSQQFNCCENCGGPHATFQCQPMNEEYYEQNSCYYPNSFCFDQYQPPQFLVNYPPQKTSREILQAQEDLMEAIQAFLNEYDHIPPNEKCMALLLAEERFLKIKQVMREEQNQPEVMQELLLKLMDDLQIFKGNQQEKKEMATQNALMDKQYRQEDIQELMSKLLEDVRNISEEFSEYINCPSWNRPLFYFDDDDDEYTELSTIPEKDKSSVEYLVPIPSGSKDVSDDICDNSDAESLLSQDIPITSPKIDFLSEEFIGEFTPIPSEMDEDEFDEEEVDCYDYDISSDDDSYENIEYVEASLLKLEYDNEDQEKKEFDLEYNSLPEFETFSYHTEETRSGSTTTHVNNFLPEYDSFLF
ncbi:hypothetical protein Tco_1296706 [Tanacetum coccineum]